MISAHDQAYKRFQDVLHNQEIIIGLLNDIHIWSRKEASADITISDAFLAQFPIASIEALQAFFEVEENREKLRAVATTRFAPSDKSMARKLIDFILAPKLCFLLYLPNQVYVFHSLFPPECTLQLLMATFSFSFSLQHSQSPGHSLPHACRVPYLAYVLL